MLFAFCGMLRFGIAASLLSLGALDFGLVVDSSVVMVENVVRHLAHEPSRERTNAPAAVREIVRDAAVEVREPTMFGELIIMIVYLPILTLEGVEGKLFRPMALTVIFALVGSLVLSLTLMPVLASLLLPRRLSAAQALAGAAGRVGVRPAPAAALRHRWLVLASGDRSAWRWPSVLALTLGWEFVPRLSEGRPRRHRRVPRAPTWTSRCATTRSWSRSSSSSSRRRSSTSGAGAAPARSPPTRWASKRPTSSSPSSRAASGAGNPHAG